MKGRNSFADRNLASGCTPCIMHAYSVMACGYGVPLWEIVIIRVNSSDSGPQEMGYIYSLFSILLSSSMELFSFRAITFFEFPKLKTSRGNFLVSCS